MILMDQQKNAIENGGGGIILNLKTTENSSNLKVK